MLARRLINQQSISMDAEEFMITKLKVFFLYVYSYNLFILNSKYVVMNLLVN
jgi:hypothetical protein